MPNDTVPPVDEKPIEKPIPETQSEDKGYDYRADHNRPIESIAKTPTATPVEKPNDEKPVEKPAEDLTQLDKTNPLEAARKYLDEQRERDRKALEESKKESERTAKETVADELRKDSERKVQEAKDAEDERPVWERENRDPKDWAEVASEDRRLAERSVWKKFNEQREQERLEVEKKRQEQATKQQTDLQVIQDTIGREMEELYQGGYLPRPQKAGDPNDPGEQMKEKLFKLGVEVNQERTKQNLPPESSIAKVFFMNQDKLKVTQPAGADAPVAGSTPVNIPKEPQGYVYARDHRPSETLTQYARRISKQSRSN